MKLQGKLTCFWVVIIGFLTEVRGKMETIPLPRSLKHCLEENNWHKPSITDEEAIVSCMVDYMWKNNRKCRSVSSDTVEWFKELAVKRTRHIMRNPIPRERKEYRMLTDEERNDYHKAVNLLKKNTATYPNKYDAFVDFHRGIAGTAAHRGPAFLGWHRYFLVLFEQALQEEVPGVMLPYWDSTLDTEMSDPLDSVIWTNLFAGNGNGSVRTGPFADWVTPNGQRLTRAIGQGQLMDKQTVSETLVSHDHHDTFGWDLETQHDKVHIWIGGHMGEIETAPSDPMFFLHHAYIDCVWETFRVKFANPEDDYPSINGSHAADEYMANLPQFPDDSFSPFGGKLLRNKDGYRNFWTERYYRCAPPPECSFKKPDCGSKWLQCNVFTQRCVSKKASAALPKVTPEQMMNVMYQCYPDRMPSSIRHKDISNDVPTISYDYVSDGGRFYTYITQTQYTTTTIHTRKKRNAKRDFRHFIQQIQTQRQHSKQRIQIRKGNRVQVQVRTEQTTTPNPYVESSGGYEPTTTTSPNAHVQIQWQAESNTKPLDRIIQVQTKTDSEEVDTTSMTIDQFYIPDIDKPCDGYPIQNIFTINCKSDIKLWVFVAVKVVHFRHGNVKYPTYDTMDRNGQFKEQDIYSGGEWIEFSNGRPLPKRPSSKKCHNDMSGLEKIRITSFGLNYDGKFSDNVFVDNRQPVSETITFIAIKEPGMESTKVLFTAVDQCGIACRAYCLSKQLPGGVPKYEECSGSMEFTAKSPLMYHKTYLDGAGHVWKKSSSGVLCADGNEIPIIFYCDYKDNRPTELFG